MMMMQLPKFLSNVQKDEESICDSDGHPSVSLESNHNSKDDDDDSDPEKRDAGHGRDEYPQLLWREFGDDTEGRENYSNAFSKNEEEEIVFCHDDNETETNESDKESSSGALDEIQNQSEVGTVPKSNNLFKNSYVSISLDDEGWKGIMVKVLDEIESSSCDEAQNMSSSYRSFPSVDAWVSDDEHSNASTLKSRNPKTPAYEALVLDSMLNAETESKTEKDSLLWTWIGGDNNHDSIDKNNDVPPTQEIAFLGSREDTEHKRSDDGDDSSVSVSSLEEKETLECGNDPTDNNVPSLSLFAACTYSRVFGLDYLESYHNNSDESDTEEEYIDWSSVDVSPMRSTIPFGTFQNDGTSHSTTAASSGSGSDYHENADEWKLKCIETWFWILFSAGVVLVVCLVNVVFYCGVEDAQAF